MERKVILLDVALITDEKDLHGYLREQMSLPDYYGDNLDALYDVLTDITADTEIRLRNGHLLAERLGWYGRQFLRVLRDASDDNGYLTLTEVASEQEH